LGYNTYIIFHKLEYYVVIVKEEMQASTKTTIAPDVLLTIAKLNALSVDGVSRLATFPGSVDRLFKRGLTEGVSIVVENNSVNADIFVIVSGDYNAREVSRNIQLHVSRAISEMVGMDVGRIDVHIEDIDFNKEASS
jgi:uncharacterized alkaline shock family protein YloU